MAFGGRTARGAFFRHRHLKKKWSRHAETKDIAKKARLTGQIRNKPGRFKDRLDAPQGEALGEAPEWFNEAQNAAWAEYVEAWPWVSRSDGPALEFLCIVTAKIRDPEEDVRISLLATHRQLIADFGGSPTSRNCIDWPPESDEDDMFAQFQN